MIRGAVLGADVSNSRSPAIHRAAFRALNVEGSYEAFSVDARGFRGLVRRLAAGGFDYVNVTIPHKRAAAALADVRTALVRATGAANTLIFPHRGRRDAIRADNTDGYGLMTALGDMDVIARAGDVFVLVGSGGAAAGGLAALLAKGVRVRIVARRTAAARALGRGLPLRQRARIQIFPWTPAGLAQAVTGAHALIAAVPAAAWQSAESRAGLASLTPSSAVLEMAYGAPTPLGAAARDRGVRYQDGIPMLVHQAAQAIALALGKMPPSAPLLEAARA